MQQTSALYKQIIELTNSWYETTVVIGEGGDLVTETGETILFGGTAIVVSRVGPESGYSEALINSIKTEINMFDKEPSVGEVVSQEIDLVMMKPAGDLPPMSVVIPYVRAVSDRESFIAAYHYTPSQENLDGDFVSEWLQQGQFFIDTRESSQNDDGTTENAFPTVKIHGYDALMKSEQSYGESSLQWPAMDIDIVREIASKLGVRVDQRTIDLMTEGYVLPALTNYSLREALGILGCKYLGCWIMSDNGALRLVTLLELPKETNYLIDYHGNCITFGGDRILI